MILHSVLLSVHRAISCMNKLLCVRRWLNPIHVSGETALIGSGAARKRKEREHSDRSPPDAVHRLPGMSAIPHSCSPRVQNSPHCEDRVDFKSASGDGHVSAGRRVLHSAASREAGTHLMAMVSV